MNDILRVLHITGGMNMGGIENFIMNIYRNIDRNKVQFDFLIHQEEKQVFEEEIKKLGGRIYRIPSLAKVGHFKYLKELRNFFENHKEYKIVHSHYNTISGIILREARKCGIKNRIAHSHTAYPKYRFIERIYKEYSKRLINSNSTLRFACSQEAGEWLYDKTENYIVIKNGIETNKFLFNESLRKDIRSNLNIEEEQFALVTVGRLSLEKNYDFILDIMKEIKIKDKSIKLFMIGTGELKKRFEERIKKEEITNVELLGVKNNINELLNGMDLMLFPSLFEGLGIVAIEAQTNSLMVFASKNIPKETNMNIGYFQTIPLDKKLWLEQILDKKKNKMIRKRDLDNLISEYNIDIVVKNIEKIYLEMR